MNCSKKVAKCLSIILLIAISLCILSCFTQPLVAEENNNTVSERAVDSSIPLKVVGENGRVKATAKNSSIMLFVKADVYVYLYSSAEAKELYEDMTLRDWEFCTDLAVGKSVTVECGTYGEQLYWRARVRYKISNGEWKEKVSPIYLIDGNGNVLG